MCVFMYICEYVFYGCLCTCEHVCGGQRPTTGIIPQDLSAWCFDTGSLSRTWDSPSSSFGNKLSPQPEGFYFLFCKFSFTP